MFLQVHVELVLDFEAHKTLISAFQQGMFLSSTFVQHLVQAVFNLH